MLCIFCFQLFNIFISYIFVFFFLVFTLNLILYHSLHFICGSIGGNLVNSALKLVQRISLPTPSFNGNHKFDFGNLPGHTGFYQSAAQVFA